MTLAEARDAYDAALLAAHEAKRRLVAIAIAEAGGNRTVAARLTGLSLRTIQRHQEQRGGLGGRPARPQTMHSRDTTVIVSQVAENAPESAQ